MKFFPAISLCRKITEGGTYGFSNEYLKCDMVDIVHSLTRVIQNSTEIRNDILRLNFLKEASIIKMRTLEGISS